MAESKNMDTVLGQAADADLEFDTIFDCEDELVDTVCGCNEAGIPFTEADLEGDFDDLHNTDRDASAKDFEDTLDTAGDANGAKNVEGTDKVNDVKGSDLDTNKSGEFADLHNEDRNETPKEFEKDGQTPGDAQGAKNPEGVEDPQITKKDLDSDKSGEFADLHNEDRDTTPKEFEKDGQTPGDAQGAKNPEGVEDPQIKEKDLNEASVDEGCKKEGCAKDEACAKKEGSEEEVEEKCGDKKESCSCGKEDCPICGKKGKKVKSIDEILDSDDDEDDTVVEPGEEGEEGTTESASIDIDDFDLLEAASGDTDVFAALGDDEEVADDLKDIQDVDSASGKATDLSYKGSEDEDLIDMVLGEN